MAAKLSNLLTCPQEMVSGALQDEPSRTRCLLTILKVMRRISFPQVKSSECSTSVHPKLFQRVTKFMLAATSRKLAGASSIPQRLVYGPSSGKVSFQIKFSNGFKRLWLRHKFKHPKNWETALWGKERLY